MAKLDDLGDEMARVQAEGAGNLRNRIFCRRRRKKTNWIHIKKYQENTRRASTAPRQDLFARQVNGKEHNTFREGCAQNCLNQDRRGRAGVTTHSLGRFHTNEADTKGSAQSGQPDVQVARHFGQNRHKHIFPFFAFSAVPAIEHGQTAEIYLVVRLFVVTWVMLANKQCKHRREEHKHQGLHHSYEDLQKIEWNRDNDRAEPARKDSRHGFQHVFAGIDIAKQTKA